MKEIEKILNELLNKDNLKPDEHIYNLIEETRKKQAEVIKQKDIDYILLEKTYCNI